MYHESYYSGVTGLRTDSRRQKWVKILLKQQTADGSFPANNPLLGNSKRELAAKFLAALGNTTVKNGGTPRPLIGVRVSNAGFAGVNGDLIRIEPYGGKFLYLGGTADFDGINFSGHGSVILWNSGVSSWFVGIVVGSSFIGYYRSSQDTVSPDLVSTWIDLNGLPPVPVVSALY